MPGFMDGISAEATGQFTSHERKNMINEVAQAWVVGALERLHKLQDTPNDAYMPMPKAAGRTRGLYHIKTDLHYAVAKVEHEFRTNWPDLKIRCKCTPEEQPCDCKAEVGMLEVFCVALW